jgi:hypothetical protein
MSRLPSWILHFALVAFLGLFAYSNTFEVPFHFDDKIMVIENPTVKNFQYFTDPSKAKDFQSYSGFISRYVGYLSFALNYNLHGLDVTGYHVTNLAIHIVNALLVYLIVLLTFRTPRMKESRAAAGAGYIALFSALLFVSHPVQTQAVSRMFLSGFPYLLHNRTALSEKHTPSFVLRSVLPLCRPRDEDQGDRLHPSPCRGPL